MASGQSRTEASCVRPLCRDFSRGSCRWGPSCRFSHDGKPAQVCRYFQSGFCCFGEQCSYQHIQEEPAPVGTQYGVTPRRPCNQEPGTDPTAVDQAQSTSVHPACSMTSMAFKFPKVKVEVEEKEEKDKENIPALGNVPCEVISGEFVPTKARGASDFQPEGPDPDSSDPREAVLETATDPAKVPAEPGAVAALVTTAELRAQSEAIECGICMDRVYEKALPEERLFGILPNCSHAYCVSCIRKWRCSQDFERAVIKACPECRTTSTYYIPHKYWISDVGEKEELIRTFKARTGKIRCRFFVRGHCPFRSECIYLHEQPARPLRRQRRRRPRRRRPRVPTVFISSSSDSSDEEDEEYEWALTLAMLERDDEYVRYVRELRSDYYFSRYRQELLYFDFDFD